MIEKKLRSVLRKLQIWMIRRKRTLTTRQAALYLDTDVVTIYRLTQCYGLPCHKTSYQLLIFYRKEIDSWLKPRNRGGMPASPSTQPGH